MRGDSSAISDLHVRWTAREYLALSWLTTVSSDEKISGFLSAVRGTMRHEQRRFSRVIPVLSLIPDSLSSESRLVSEKVSRLLSPEDREDTLRWCHEVVWRLSPCSTYHLMRRERFGCVRRGPEEAEMMERAR